MTHSTSLRATGSVREPSTPVASSWRFLRARSMACFTTVTSSGEVAPPDVVAKGAAIRGLAGVACEEGLAEGALAGVNATGPPGAPGVGDVVCAAVGRGATGLAWAAG